MKIISPRFDDYYDQIVHVFGPDKKIVFDRTLKFPSHVELYVSDSCLISIPNLTRERLYKRIRTDPIVDLSDKQGIQQIVLLSVCGLPIYVGVAERPVNSELNTTIERFMVLPSEELTEELWKRREPDRHAKNRYLMDLHNRLGSPLFISDYYDYGDPKSRSQNVFRFSIWPSVPRLADIRGLSTVYSKEQMYQDICYWIANIKNGSPDLQSPGSPGQTNQEKVESHGLDLRHSFRHRKNDFRPGD